jgi:hypothetical protein
MRLACGLAITLWLSFPAAGMARQQEAAGGAANSAGQAPAAPAPRENASAEATPAAAKKASAKAATKKADAGSAGPGAAKTGAAKTGAAKTRSASGTRKRRQRTAPAPDGAPRKIVVREGGASEPAAQIVPGMTPAEATRQRQNAERLLGATGDQLKQLAGRPLDPQRQETVEQIRNYMEGARSALKEGDVQRASTLAEKAHLLAEDLVTH